MKLLFFTSKPIFPSVDGGCFASEKLLNCLLHAQVDVKYVTLSTNKHAFDRSKFPTELIEKVDPIDFFVDTDIRLLQAFFHIFKSGSYNTDRFYSQEVEAALCKLIKTESFDGIVLDSLYTLPYLKAIRTIFTGKIALRTHNVEHQLWEQYAEDASGLKKWYLTRLASDLKQFETRELNNVDAVFSISKDDSAIFKQLGITAPIIEIPVSIAVSKRTLQYEGQNIYHIGMMDWKPNQQAVQQLIDWMPRLREHLPNLELHIAGSKSAETITSDEKNGVFVHGFVDSIEDFSLEHGILVSPIRAASGVRIKFLESMASGVPIVTTKLGALGIDLTPPACICIAETEEEFTHQIIELVSNPAKRREIGTNALNYIEKNHNIEAISQTIVEVFKGNT